MEKRITKNKNDSMLYGLVLAGGRSKRMGTDKAALRYGKAFQSEQAFKLLKKHCAKVFISNREEQTEWPGHAGFPQIHDTFQNIGPMGGILSAQKKHPGIAWLVVACDLPFLDNKTLEQLIRRRNRRKIATAFSSAHDGLPEPLCAIYEAESHDPLQEFAQHGLYCPRKALMRSDIQRLQLENREALDNINQPEEYECARQTLRLAPKKNLRGKKESGRLRTLHLHYHAMLREQRGCPSETIKTTSINASGLYEYLRKRHGFTLSRGILKVAINDEIKPWTTRLKDGDSIIFIPPVSGG